MPRGSGFEDGLFGQHGARVVAQRRQLAKFASRSSFGYHGGAAADARRCFENGGAQLGEDALFDLDGVFVGGEDFAVS